MIAILAVIALTSFQQEKKYTVSLTIQEWQAVINSIDSKQISGILEKQLIPQLKDSIKTK